MEKRSMIAGMKKALAISLLTFVGFSSSACSSDNKPEVQAKTESLAMASNTETVSYDTKVGEIKTVAKAEKNKAVDFTFMKDGKEVSFKEYTKGKIVFLNFWGTWCPPCRAEIPGIIEIANELKDKDFIVIGVALERGSVADNLKKVYDYAKDKGLNYYNVLGNKDLIQAYGGIPYVPTTFIIDKDGNIAEKIDGGREKADFMASINKVIK